METNVISRDRYDHKIIFIVVSLIAFGLVMIYSVASSQNNMTLFIKQAGCMVIGLGIMYVAQHWSTDLLRPLAIPTYAISYILIFALLLPEPFTRTVNGATRWLNFGFAFQVAEFVKIAVILMLAYWTEQSRYRSEQEEFKFIISMWAIGAVPTLLLMVISDDLSSSMVVAGITFTMTFLASRGKLGWIFHIVGAVGVVLLVVVAVVYVQGHMPTESELLNGEVSFRIGRVAAWISPERYAKSTGFQPMHCLYAIANGGWFGKGLGQSWQKAILPESENDVIFAIIIEELGIFGGIVLIFLFGVLVHQMCKVVYNTKDLFGKMIVMGIVAHMMLQVIIHCGVCTNALPNTGIGLPFISSGMTASLFQLAEMALVLSVARAHIFNLYEKRQAKIREKRRQKRQNTARVRNATGRTTRPTSSSRTSATAGSDRATRSTSTSNRTSGNMASNRTRTMGTGRTSTRPGARATSHNNRSWNR